MVLSDFFHLRCRNEPLFKTATTWGLCLSLDRGQPLFVQHLHFPEIRQWWLESSLPSLPPRRPWVDHLGNLDVLAEGMPRISCHIYWCQLGNSWVWTYAPIPMSVMALFCYLENTAKHEDTKKVGRQVAEAPGLHWKPDCFLQLCHPLLHFQCWDWHCLINMLSSSVLGRQGIG